jgi:hypothetical protein
MNTSQFFKGLLMALVAVIVSLFTAGSINWVLAGVAIVAAILSYFGKNLIPWLHSDSPVGTLSLLNIVSGLLIALSVGILNGVGEFIVSGAIMWAILWKQVAFVTLSYLNSTFFAGPYSLNKVKGLGK